MNATRYLPFVGRMFIGLPFVVSGLSKLANYAGDDRADRILQPPAASAAGVRRSGCRRDRLWSPYHRRLSDANRRRVCWRYSAWLQRSSFM